MTPSEETAVRVAVATEAGWKRENSPFSRHGYTITDNVGGDVWWHETKAGCQSILPTYTTSIDATREAVLARDEGFRNAFDAHLYSMGYKNSAFLSFHQLTALDWCRAYLAAANKPWPVTAEKEEEP